MPYLKKRNIHMNITRTIARSTTCIDVFTKKDLKFYYSQCYNILNLLSSSKPGLKVTNRFKSKWNKYEL